MTSWLERLKDAISGTPHASSARRPAVDEVAATIPVPEPTPEPLPGPVPATREARRVEPVDDTRRAERRAAWRAAIER